MFDEQTLLFKCLNFASTLKRVLKKVIIIAVDLSIKTFPKVGEDEISFETIKVLRNAKPPCSKSSKMDRHGSEIFTRILTLLFFQLKQVKQLSYYTK